MIVIKAIFHGQVLAGKNIGKDWISGNQLDSPNDPTLPPLEDETPTPSIVNTDTSEKTPEIKQNFVVFFKWKDQFTAISIVIGAVLVTLCISLYIKKFYSSRQKKSPKVNVNISNV